MCALILHWCLGSGPKEADDLCYHKWGNFSSSLFIFSFLCIPPSPRPQDPNLGLKTQIPTLRPKSQPQRPHSILEAQILASRPMFLPQGPNPSLRAQIPLRRGRRRNCLMRESIGYRVTALLPPSTSITIYISKAREPLNIYVTLLRLLKIISSSYIILFIH